MNFYLIALLVSEKKELKVAHRWVSKLPYYNGTASSFKIRNPKTVIHVFSKDYIPVKLAFPQELVKSQFRFNLYLEIESHAFK